MFRKKREVFSTSYKYDIKRDKELLLAFEKELEGFGKEVRSTQGAFERYCEHHGYIKPHWKNINGHLVYNFSVVVKNYNDENRTSDKYISTEVSDTSDFLDAQNKYKALRALQDSRDNTKQQNAEDIALNLENLKKSLKIQK